MNRIIFIYYIILAIITLINVIIAILHYCKLKSLILDMKRFNEIKRLEEERKIK